MPVQHPGFLDMCMLIEAQAGGGATDLEKFDGLALPELCLCRKINNLAYEKLKELAEKWRTANDIYYQEAKERYRVWYEWDIQKRYSNFILHPS